MKVNQLSSIKLIPVCLILAFFMLNGTVQADDPPIQATPPTNSAESSGNRNLDSDVWKMLQSSSPNDMLTVIVTLKDQANLNRITIQAAPNRSTRLRNVVTDLRSTAAAGQRRLKALLGNRRAEGRVSQVTYFWVFNGLAVTATPDVIQELATQPEVFNITPNLTIQAPSVVSEQGQVGVLSNEPNLELIDVPTMWNMGFRGQGIVVANTDTGVDLNHPDLGPKWRGGTNSWFDPYGQYPTTPVDIASSSSGHGTQSMGIMVGGQDSGTSYGIAPDAQWIAVKIFDQSGNGTALGFHAGLQWLLDPDGNPATPDAPHVVSNSWAVAQGCNLAFQLDLQALRAAGILPIFSAGNSAGTSHSPANYPEAFAVGAADNSDIIWGSSSRGPSACDGTVYPEVVAPGVNIHTTDLAPPYTDVTGTSFSAPHVAGILALVLSASPNLTVAEQESILLNTSTDLGAVGPDNTYGYGRINVLAAHLEAYSDASMTISPTITDSLAYMDPQGSLTTVLFPTGAVTETTKFFYKAIETSTGPPPTGLISTDHMFTLDAYRNALLSGLTLAQPATVTIHYTDADVSGLDEQSLTLYYWGEGQGQWIDAATTCLPVSSYNRQPQANWLAVPICHLSEFALFGKEQEHNIYLPLLLK